MLTVRKSERHGKPTWIVVSDRTGLDMQVGPDFQTEADAEKHLGTLNRRQARVTALSERRFVKSLDPMQQWLRR